MIRLPIRLNKTFWPKSVTTLFPDADDPRILLDSNVTSEQFSKAVSVFKFGTTFKTTAQLRFPLMVNALKSLDYDTPPIVLDIAASDGITSLHVINNLPYTHYYVTDLNQEVACYERDGTYYFYAPNHECILVVTKHFVIYSDYENAVFPLNKIARLYFQKAPQVSYSQLRKIKLINVELMKILENNISVLRYDMSQKWEHQAIDLVLAANILNRSYFPDSEILAAVDNMIEALRGSGWLAIVDNRDIEKGTIFRVNNRALDIEKDINGGTEIKALLMEHRVGDLSRQ